MRGPTATGTHRTARLTVLALAGLLAALVGCERPDVRVVETLPPAVFREPPTDWPDTAPDDAHPLRLDDLEAGWRNHAFPARRWQWIVIHHSSTPGGNARNFDAFHRDDRGWDELGYHFVIGNGRDSPDGRIEAGSRWVKQRHGAHCHTPSRQFNEAGIGVCLVGDFQSSQPTPAQWTSAVQLCGFLRREYGIPADRIIGHRDAQATEGSATTDCPGRNLDVAALRRAVAAPSEPGNRR